MTRAFSAREVPDAILVDIVDLASRSPSAGKSQGWNLVVLRGARTDELWSRTFTPESRRTFRWQAMFDAPIVALSFADPDAYLARYSEPDKAHTGLGESPERWPAPTWTIDAAFATMTLLHAAHDRGLGALFFHVDKGRNDVLAALGIPVQWVLLGAVALGWPLNATGESAASDPALGAGRSANRRRRPATDIIHFDRYSPGAR